MFRMQNGAKGERKGWLEHWHKVAQGPSSPNKINEKLKIHL